MQYDDDEDNNNDEDDRDDRDDRDDDNDDHDDYSCNSVNFPARTSKFCMEEKIYNTYNMIMMEMTIMILMMIMIMIMMKMIIAVIQSIFKLGPKICLKSEVDEDKQSTHSRLQGKLPKTQTNKY